MVGSSGAHIDDARRKLGLTWHASSASYDPGCSPSFLRKGDRCTISQRWPNFEGPSQVAPRPWLALGILMAPSRDRRFRAAFNLLMREEVEWRFVVAKGWDHRGADDPRVVQTPCPDGEAVKQLACFCKTTWWFRRALALFPTTAFIGKLEEDTIVHTARLLQELRWAVRSTDPRAMVWYGHFQWAVHRKAMLTGGRVLDAGMAPKTEMLPLSTAVYAADPSAHLFEGRIYVYCSHDSPTIVEGLEVPLFNMVDYVVLSRDTRGGGPTSVHVNVLRLKDVPWASGKLWAPDAAYKNGKYYLFLPAQDRPSIFRIGVAT